jgi:hypothetical protein
MAANDIAIADVGAGMSERIVAPLAEIALMAQWFIAMQRERSVGPQSLLGRCQLGAVPIK